jgi:5,10-methylenetetrahydromethanopterin reductase
MIGSNLAANGPTGRDGIGDHGGQGGGPRASARFGAGFLGNVSGTVTVPEVARTAELCERHGLDSFWVADQRWMRDPYVSLAAAATRTGRLLLGTRVTDPYVRHPALTAVAMASLDELSGGRAVLGIGSGGSGFAQIGLRRERPVAALREAIGLIRQLWRGDPAALDGEVVRWNGGRLGFDCRPDIPVVLATRGPRLLELAGELADGAIIAAGTSPEAIAWARERIAAGERRAGRDPGATELLHMTYVSLDRDPRLARQAVKQGVLGAVVGSHPRYDFLRAAGLEVPPELFGYLESGQRDRRRIIELIPDAMVDKLAVAGTADDCAEQLARLLDQGIQHVLLAPIPAGEGGAAAMLEQVLTRVLPAVRAA